MSKSEYLTVHAVNDGPSMGTRPRDRLKTSRNKAVAVIDYTKCQLFVKVYE